VIELAGCGHALMSERPDEVLDALRGFAGALPFEASAQSASA